MDQQGEASFEQDLVLVVSKPVFAYISLFNRRGVEQGRL